MCYLSRYRLGTRLWLIAFRWTSDRIRRTVILRNMVLLPICRLGWRCRKGSRFERLDLTVIDNIYLYDYCLFVDSGFVPCRVAGSNMVHATAEGVVGRPIGLSVSPVDVVYNSIDAVGSSTVRGVVASVKWVAIVWYIRGSGWVMTSVVPPNVTVTSAGAGVAIREVAYCSLDLAVAFGSIATSAVSTGTGANIGLVSPPTLPCKGDSAGGVGWCVGFV